MATTNPTFNPSGNPKITEIKEAVRGLEAIILGLPPTRRRSVALTQLETAAMWAVKAAAVGDDE